jgi:hypothetical protein
MSEYKQVDKVDNDYYTKLNLQLSLSIATGTMSIICNPLEVLKYRSMIDMKSCSFDHFSNKSLYRTWKGLNPGKTKHCTNCFQSTNFLVISKDIYQKEGIFAFARGIGPMTLLFVLKNFIHISFYENFRRKFTGKIDPLILPGLSAFVGKTASFSMTFPLEAIVIRYQGTSKSKKIDLKKINYFKGGFSTFMVETSFSCIYWTIYHNLFPVVQRTFFNEDEVWMPSQISSTCAGLVGVLTSHPFDLIRAMKMLNEEKFGELSNVDCLKQVYRSFGYRGLTVGLSAKFIRSGGLIALFNWFYLTSREILKENGI